MKIGFGSLQTNHIQINYKEKTQKVKMLCVSFQSYKYDISSWCVVSHWAAQADVNSCNILY